MPGLLLALSLSAVAVAATAAPRAHVEGPAVTIRTEPGLVRRWLQGAVGAMATHSERAGSLLIFPVAGNARGANGEFFRSDVTLISYKEEAPQAVGFVFLRSGSTDDPAVATFTLEPDTYHNFTDFVGIYMQRQNELGAVVVVPLKDDLETIDGDAAIDGFSRIWTHQPGGSGTVSQPFPATQPAFFPVAETATAMGLRHDSSYRSNYGLLNFSGNPLTFNITFNGERKQEATTLVLPSLGMIHQAVPAGNFGALAVEFTVDDPEAIWIGYGTSTDNRSGDGWVAIASMKLRPAELDEIED